MVTLVCAVVGQKGSVFAVEIDENKLVDALKDAIAVKEMYEFPSSKLQLHLGKIKENTWLDSRAVEALTLDGDGYPKDFMPMDPSFWIKNSNYFGENFEPNKGEIHVLVVVPKQDTPHDLQVAREQIVQADEWFVNKLFSIPNKKRKLDEEESDQSTRYFKMVGFPNLAHPRQVYNTIMIRDAYDAILKN